MGKNTRDIKKFIDYAKEQGAKNARDFIISDIAFDSRVILKCMFGCEDFGKGHTCPYQRSPLNMEEYKKIFELYEYGIIINCDNKRVSQNISYEIERMAFLEGYYFAFSLSDCAVCKTCALGDALPCRFPKKARPAFHSVGIDVFKTARELGLPIKVLRDKDAPQNWYSAVFLE